MYKSPVEIIYGQMRTSVENDVVRAVMGVGVNVDKEELIRALKYDRGQYEKGYQDAVHDKDLVEVVHGYWEWTETGEQDYEQFWVCSQCGDRTYFLTNYCPNCGADMRERKDNG